jgi:hypothetical protein
MSSFDAFAEDLEWIKLNPSYPVALRWVIEKVDILKLHSSHEETNIFTQYVLPFLNLP